MSLALAAALAFSSTATVPACSWDQPGMDPFMGNVVEAVERYTNIPPDVRDKLKKRMATRQYDEIATIRRDSITGNQRYSPEISDMHFGQGRVCRSVSRAAWSPSAVERGLVYCEGEHCIIVPTVCRNVSRITRLPPARPVPSAGAVIGPGLPQSLAGGSAAALTPGTAESAAVPLDMPVGPLAAGGELVFEPPGAGGGGGVPSAIWSALAAIAGSGSGLNNEGGSGGGGIPAINFNPYATGGGGAGGGGSFAPPAGGNTTTLPGTTPILRGPDDAIDTPSMIPPSVPLPTFPPILEDGVSPAIPEPGTWALMLAGCATLLTLQRRQRRGLRVSDPRP